MASLSRTRIVRRSILADATVDGAAVAAGHHVGYLAGGAAYPPRMSHAPATPAASFGYHAVRYAPLPQQLPAPLLWPSGAGDLTHPIPAITAGYDDLFGHSGMWPLLARRNTSKDMHRLSFSTYSFLCRAMAERRHKTESCVIGAAERRRPSPHAWRHGLAYVPSAHVTRGPTVCHRDCCDPSAWRGVTTLQSRYARRGSVCCLCYSCACSQYARKRNTL